jgi:chromosome segregation ATPase
MATQPESHDDLDRTDELPRLDVAAYEASLAKAGGDGLSRTDTWTVEALQDLDEVAEVARQPPSSAPRDTTGSTASNNEFNLNVARILQRMAQLEADIADAHEANAALQKRSDAIQAARDEQMVRIRALETDNARLAEHHSLSGGMQERFEQQLREQSQHTDTQLTELQSARFAERLRMDQEREDFRRQLTETAAQVTALQQDNRRLQDQLHASTALANRHAASLAALEGSLGDEKAGATQLARQLAVKLTDYETLSSMVEARNRSINDLVRTRDDLQLRLERESASGVQLTAQLALAQKDLQEHRAALTVRDDSITEKDTRLSELTNGLLKTGNELELLRQQYDAATQSLSKLDAAQSESHSALSQRLQEISALRGSLEAAESEAAQARHELLVAAAAATDQENRRLELEARLEEARQQARLLTGERDAALEQVRGLSDERDALLPASDQLIERSEELERTRSELSQLQTEMTALRTELNSHVAAAQARAAESASLQDSAIRLRYSRDSLQEALEEAQRTIDQLRDEEQARAQLLTERTEELAGLHTRFSEHAMTMRGLEHAIRARDELADKLRGQLQVTQDERAIMADLLEKSRARVKTMAQQVFQRDNQVASLRADLAARAEALAAIRRDVDRVEADVVADSFDQLALVLEPIGHDGDPIFLNSKLITVGRTSENDVCIPSKLISRRHARLLVGAAGATIEDAGSTNGCFVNGQQVQSHPLQEGDVLELGDLRYRLYSRPSSDTRIRANVVPISDGRRGD